MTLDDITGEMTNASILIPTRLRLNGTKLEKLIVLETAKKAAKKRGL